MTAHKYMSTADASIKWDVSRQRVRQFLAQGRVRGAYRLGRDWLIPAQRKPTLLRAIGKSD